MFIGLELGIIHQEIKFKIPADKRCWRMVERRWAIAIVVLAQDAHLGTSKK